MVDCFAKKSTISFHWKPKCAVSTGWKLLCDFELVHCRPEHFKMITDTEAVKEDIAWRISLKEIVKAAHPAVFLGVAWSLKDE